MTTNIGDFFLVSNSVHNVTDEDYLKINILINAAKAFARSTHQCVYIIDYFKQNFLYVSENLAYWCGQTSDRIKDFGYRFYLDYVPEKEQQMLLEINRKGFDLFNEIPFKTPTLLNLLNILNKGTINAANGIIIDKRIKLNTLSLVFVL